MSDLERAARDYVVRERSDYQLQHFVIGQHDTPEMRYRQILIEAKNLMFKIRNAEIELEMTQLKIDKLESTDNKIKHLRAEQLRLGMNMTLDALEAARRELAYLSELMKEYRYYSPEDIEANQPEYWEKRLTRQASTDRMALEQGISAGNITSMINSGLFNKEITQ